MTAVTFDFGQVLGELDTAFLVKKLRERGHDGSPEALDRATPKGWIAYGEALRSGGHGAGAWKTFLATVLVEGGAAAAATPETLDFLFDDQRPRNLWRRPVPGMIELARSLRRAGLKVGVVSNSEGALAELIASLGWTDDFDCVADSGVLGLEKPRPEIFHWAAERLGAAARDLVHIGDSYAADVEGALGVGARAIWFAQADGRPLDAARGRVARDADETKAALLAFGIPA